MYWGQISISLLAAAGGGYIVYLQSKAEIVAIGIVILIYLFFRIFLATFFRTRYWLKRGTRGSYTRNCPDCNQYIYRMKGDWILECKRCGWKAGLPVVRWVTHSVPVRQLERSITLSRAVSVGLALMLIWVGMTGGISGYIDQGGFDNNSGPSDSVVSETQTTHSTDFGALNRSRVEFLVAKYTNKKRAEHGLSELEYAPRIAEPARNHAETMAEHDFIGHTAPNGQTAEERYREVCDYSGSGYTHGENAGGAWYNRDFGAWKSDRMVYLSNESEVASYLVNAWMRSEGHRRNILSEGWQEIGVGIVIRNDGKVFAVQTFC